MNASAYFDGRSATYDQGSVHSEVATRLAERLALEPGFHVLDIATGTGNSVGKRPLFHPSRFSDEYLKK